MFSILVFVPFFSCKCMLELKFARAVSLSSQASLVAVCVLAEESSTRPGSLQTLPAYRGTSCISNSAILRNNYISLLSDCAHVYTWRKRRLKGSHSSSVSGSNHSWDFKCGKKSNGLVHCSVENAAVLYENHRERVMQTWTTPSEEERKTFWLSGDLLVWYFRYAF